MAVQNMASWESRAAILDSAFTLTGTSSISQTQARTGTSSVRLNPASGASGSIGVAASNFHHMGIYVATLPSIDRRFAGSIAAGTVNLRMTSGGAIAVYLNTTLLGTSSTAFATPGWHWVAYRQDVATHSNVDFLQIDGVSEVNASGTISSQSTTMGCAGTEATAIDMYVDDIILDGTTMLQPSKVAMLVPTADSARGTGWVGGAGGTTSLFDAVNNQPPVGVADTGTNASQIRNATSSANSNMDMTMTTYTAAGVGENDTVLAVRANIATAAPVSTSAKQGTVGIASNPTVTNVALGAGGTAGAFWSGVAGGTFPTGWKASFGTLTTSPSVTLGTAPVMRVTQVTSSTRIAMVCYMGITVAYTVGAAPADPQMNPARSQMQALLAQ